MSNYIERRITTEYLECVSEVLNACPEAYFICMGQGDNSHARNFMEQQGLAEKCRWLPKQSNCFAALKLLDFNEFPVGGSQSIRECIACGIPAMALEYSKTIMKVSEQILSEMKQFWMATKTLMFNKPLPG